MGKISEFSRERRKREREKEEREGAMFLLVNVCEQLDEAEQIEKRMGEFSSVYGETIPEWLQILHDYMAHFERKEKVVIIKEFARKHGMEIKDTGKDA